MASEDSFAPSVTVQRQLDPRLEYNKDPRFVVRAGAANIVTQRFAAQSVSPSVARWTIVSPGLEYGMARHVEVEASFLITCGALPLTPAQVWQTQTTAGPRAYPLHSVCQNIQATVNGLAVTSQMADPLHALISYGWDEMDRQYYASASPHDPDWAQTYVETAGTNRNNFASYGNSLMEDSRGGYWFEEVDANTLRLRVRESLMISPFLWGEKRSQALFNVSQFGLTLSFGDLRRVLSGQAVGVVGPAGAIFQGAANLITGLTVVPEPAEQWLHLTFLTPQARSAVPRSLVYPYSELFDYQSRVGAAVNGGVSVTHQFSNITLTTLPKRLYIYVKRAQPADAAGVVEYTDSFARIDSIQMNFANQSGRFSTLDSFDLFRMSSKNGLKVSYPAWSKFKGSVMCIEMCEDLTMANPNLVESVQGNYQLSFQVTFTDLRDIGAPPAQYEVHLTSIQTGIITSDGEIFSSQIGVLTESQVEGSEMVKASGRVEVESYLDGAGVLSDLASMAAKGVLGLWAKGAIPKQFRDLASSAYGKAMGGVRESGGAMAISGRDIASRLHGSRM